MNGLHNIKIISYFSLIFTIACFIFSFDKPVSIGGALFIWVVITNIIIFYIKGTYKKYLLSSFLMAITFFLAKSTNDIVFIILICLSSITYIYLNISKGEYGSLAMEFKSGLLMLIALGVLALFSGSLLRVFDIIGPYVIIYLVSSVILLRTLRIQEYTEENKHLNSLNIRYSVIILGASFALSARVIRMALLDGIVWIYNILADILFYIASFLFVTLGYLIQMGIYYIKRLTYGKLPKNVDTHSGTPKFPKTISDKNNFFGKFLDSEIFYISIRIIIVVLILYLIVKLYKRKNNSHKNIEYYREEKEFIVSDSKRQNKLSKILSNIIKPKNINEYIRFYYTKYLKLCVKKKIDIIESDTSKDVNIKSKVQFNEETIGAIRKIYIKVRYGNFNPDKTTANEFYKYYKKLKGEKES